MKPFRWFGRRTVESLAAAVAALWCLAPSAPASAQPRLRVSYEGSRFSVEAREVSLAAVLSEIGAKVGFSVVETAPSSEQVTLSMRDSTLDEILRRLLRAENHTVLYRTASGDASQGEAAIDRIVLSGQPGALQAVGRTSAAQDRLQGDDTSSTTDRLTGSTSPLSGPEPLSRMSWDLAVEPTSADDPAAPPITVGDLLKAQAMTADPGAPLTNVDATPAPGFSAPPDFEAPLGETTRRARRALGALMEGLATATKSLRQSTPAPGR